MKKPEKHYERKELDFLGSLKQSVQKLEEVAKLELKRDRDQALEEFKRSENYIKYEEQVKAAGNDDLRPKEKPVSYY